MVYRVINLINKCIGASYRTSIRAILFQLKCNFPLSYNSIQIVWCFCGLIQHSSSFEQRTWIDISRLIAMFCADYQLIINNSSTNLIIHIYTKGQIFEVTQPTGNAIEKLASFNETDDLNTSFNSVPTCIFVWCFMHWFTNFLPTKFVTRTIQQVLTVAQNIHPYDYVIILKESITIADQCAITLQWRHNGCDSVSNHQPHDCFLNRLFRRRSKKTSKLSVTGLCAGNSPVSGEFPAQRASNAENVSIWWRRYEPKGSGK